MVHAQFVEQARTLLLQNPSSPELRALFDSFFDAVGEPSMPPAGLTALQRMSWDRKHPSPWKDLREALGNALSRQVDRWMLEGLSRRLGPTHETVLNRASAYLKTHLYDADTVDADIAQHTVNAFRSALGDAAEKTPLVRLYQAEILATLGRYDEACAVLGEILKNEALGPDDDKRGTAAFMLGINTLRRGRTAEGLALLDAHRKAEIPRISIRSGDLMSLPQRGEDAHAKAISALESTLDGWGFDKLQTVVAMREFAQHLENSGDAENAPIARKLHQEWRDDLARTYPAEGILLARKIASEGRRTEAIELARTIVDAMRTIEERWSPAKDHRRMATHDLSGWLRDEGDINAAIECLEPVAQELLDEGAPPFPIVGNDVAFYCLRNDQIDEALSWFQAVIEHIDNDESNGLEMDQDEEIDKSEHRVDASYGVAICLGRQGKADEEEQSLLQLFEHLEEAQKLTTPTASAVVERLLAILIPRGDKRAIALQQKLVQAAESARKSHAIERERHNLGTVYAELGDTHAAEQLFRQVWEAQTKLWGEHAATSVDLWRTRRSLAKLLRDTTRDAEADAVDPGPEPPGPPNQFAGYSAFRPLRG